MIHTRLPIPPTTSRFISMIVRSPRRASRSTPSMKPSSTWSPGRTVSGSSSGTDSTANRTAYLGRLDRLEFDPPLGEPEFRVDLARGWYLRPADLVYFFQKTNLMTIQNEGGRKTGQAPFPGDDRSSTRKAAAAGYRKRSGIHGWRDREALAKTREMGVFDKTAVL